MRIRCGGDPTAVTVLTQIDGFQLDDDPARIDRDLVWTFLSEQAYWGRWRTRADVEAQLDSAWRVIGVYRAGGEQVGFARAISDGVSFGYLCDVFVVQSARGQGLGSRMVRALVDTGPGAGMRWLLHTSHSHGLYAQFGFQPADQTVMERPRHR
jgi:GNAT superfamily N-acetyltransferase